MLIVLVIFIVIFIHDFCIINEDLSYTGGFEFVSIFVMVCHFYDAFLWHLCQKGSA